MKTKILFVCTANENRSVSAENLFKNKENLEVSSAGVHPLSRKPLTQEIINWADIIVVMDEKRDNHKTILLQMYPNAKNKQIIDLDIPDIYEKNNPELLELIKKRMKEKGVIKNN
ncbi:MAG: phosphotyrosine protein phosphatase [Minisyncoccales bacterium]